MGMVGLHPAELKAAAQELQEQFPAEFIFRTVQSFALRAILRAVDEAGPPANFATALHISDDQAATLYHATLRAALTRQNEKGAPQ